MKFVTQQGRLEMLSAEEFLPVRSVIGFPVAALSFQDQVALVLKWAKCGLSKVVCIANVHMLIEAHKNPQFASVLQEADLVTPDGMPLVWMLRLMGASAQERVAGPDVLSALCKLSPSEGVSLFFLGSQSAILERMRFRLKQEFPDLKIAGMEPLPFRPMTPQENAAIVQKLNESGAGIVLVSLGCPKQEIWMAENKNKVQMVMIGLGGAFPVYAEIYKRAPKFLQTLGFEWLYRLVQEPQRLWKRYLETIPVFIYLALKQLLISIQAGLAAKKL
ncbi:MAG TPA: WecB/TagA/CpsF family glycosyltransferase, partial [Coleofasciculaceae cyanobacterium]